MAIAPLQIPQANINSNYDFSPLAKLGEMLKQNREEQEAAELIANLYGQAGRQMPGQQAAAPSPAGQPSPLASLPSNIRTNNQSSPLDTANWPAGPVGAPINPLTPNERVAEGFDAIRPRSVAPTAVASAAPTAFAPEEPTEQPRYSDTGLENALRVIRQKESSGNYANVTDAGRGRKVYGAYGVLDANIPTWTKEALGRSLTPEEFLNSPQAQDAVARHKFGEYAGKYGLSGAAKAWLAGEGGMNTNRADRFGTTPTAYASDFNRKLGLPNEITQGRSGEEEPSQAMGFDAVRDRAVQNLSTPSQPAAQAGLGREQIAALYRNPLTRPLAVGFLQKQLDPGTYEFMTAGDSIIRYNKRDGTYTTIPTSQKPVAVSKGGKVYDPNLGKFVGGEDEAADLPDPASGYLWVDKKDPNKGQIAIKGGPAEKVEAETAARIGLAKSFQGELPSIMERLQSGELGIDNPANHVKGLARVGASGELARKIDSGADSLLRMLTGAGMNKEEAADYVLRYRLGARDTQASLISKMNQLNRELTSISAEVGKGRGGAATPNQTGISQADYNKLPSGATYVDGNGVTRRKR